MRMLRTPRFVKAAVVEGDMGRSGVVRRMGATRFPAKNDAASASGYVAPVARMTVGATAKARSATRADVPYLSAPASRPSPNALVAPAPGAVAKRADANSEQHPRATRTARRGDSPAFITAGLLVNGDGPDVAGTESRPG